MSEPKTVIRHVTWHLRPDQEPDAEPSTFAFMCVVCGENSRASEGWEEPQAWVLGHCGRNPSHLTYREVLTRPWKTWMTP